MVGLSVGFIVAVGVGVFLSALTSGLMGFGYAILFQIWWYVLGRTTSSPLDPVISLTLISVNSLISWTYLSIQAIHHHHVHWPIMFSMLPGGFLAIWSGIQVLRSNDLHAINRIIACFFFCFAAERILTLSLPLLDQRYRRYKGFDVDVDRQQDIEDAELRHKLLAETSDSVGSAGSAGSAGSVGSVGQRDAAAEWPVTADSGGGGGGGSSSSGLKIQSTGDAATADPDAIDPKKEEVKGLNCCPGGFLNTWEFPMSILTGAVGGIVDGISGCSGPPAMIFFSYTKHPMTVQRGTYAVYAWLSRIFIVVEAIHYHFFNNQYLHLYWMSPVITILGVVLGYYCHSRIDADKLSLLVQVLILSVTILLFDPMDGSVFGLVGLVIFCSLCLYILVACILYNIWRPRSKEIIE